MFDIVRIHWPLRGWFLVLGSAAFGILHGLNMWHAWLWPPSVFDSLTGNVLLGSVILFLPWGIALNLRCQRVLVLTSCGLICGLFSALGFWYASSMSSPLGAAGLIHHQPWMPWAIAMCATVGVAVNMIILFVARSLGYRVIQQTGWLCTKCGYHLYDRRCSECGYISPDEHSSHPPYKGQALMAIVIVTAAFLLACMLWQPPHKGRSMFIMEHGSTGSFHGHMYGANGVPTWAAVGVFVSLEEPNMVLTWLHEDRPQQGQPYSQIQVMSTLTAPAGNVLPVPGDPVIIIDIYNRDVATLLLDYGINDRTKQLIRDVAVAEGWRPVLPSRRVVIVQPEVVGIGEID